MAKREYNGDDIDLSWQTAPWANDGETVGVIGGGDDEGEIAIEDVDVAVDDLSKRQQAELIRRLRKSGATYSDIRDRLGVANGTIADAAFGRGEFADINCETPPLEKNVKTVGASLTEADVSDIRERLLDGETSRAVAEDLGISEASVKKRARGDVGPDIDSPPELTGDRAGNWRVKGESGGAEAEAERIKTIRQRLLDGETARTVAEDLGISKTSVKERAHGDVGPDIDSPPELVGDHGGNWRVKEGVDEAETETDATTESDAESSSSDGGVTARHTDSGKTATAENTTDALRDVADRIDEPDTQPTTPSRWRAYAVVGAALAGLWLVVRRIFGGDGE